MTAWGPFDPERAPRRSAWLLDTRRRSCYARLSLRGDGFVFLQGKRLVFVTNNSTKSRQGYTKKFQELGLNVTAVRTAKTL